MKLLVNRLSMQIVPETAQDTAYIEEMLKLMNDGDSIPLVRVNAMNLHALAYLEVSKP